MKTIEEKAKAYDEARERAIEMHSVHSEVHKGVTEYIFPELRESEDERIRRTLVEYFGPEVQLDFVRGVPIQKIRDWLEKQKEQKPAEDKYQQELEATDRWQEGYEAGYNAASKPAEWSVEDELHLKAVLGILGQKNHPILYKFVESLRPQSHWKPSDEQLDALNAMNCCGELSYQGQQQLLIDLYRQLKKL